MRKRRNIYSYSMNRIVKAPKITLIVTIKIHSPEKKCVIARAIKFFFFFTSLLCLWEQDNFEIVANHNFIECLYTESENMDKRIYVILISFPHETKT